MYCRPTLVFCSINLSHFNTSMHKFSMAPNLWKLTTVQSINYWWLTTTGTCSYHWIDKPISPQSILMPYNLMRLSASHNGCFWNLLFAIFVTMGTSHIGSPKSVSGSPWRNIESLLESVFAIFFYFPSAKQTPVLLFYRMTISQETFLYKISFVHIRTHTWTKGRWNPFLRQPPLFKIKNILYM